MTHVKLRNAASPQATARMPEFDIAKCGAFVAVIMGHCSFTGIPTSIIQFCFSFHMPLFFIVSGYFCKPSARLDRSFVMRNIKALIIPYGLTCLFIALAAAVVGAITRVGPPMDSAIHWLVSGVWGSGAIMDGMPPSVGLIGAIWFLWALFWGRLLLAAANQMGHPAIVSLILFIVGISTTNHVWLPFSIQPGLCATLFLCIGQLSRTHDVFERGKVSPLLWFCAFMTWLYCAVFFGQMNMAANSYPAGAIDVIGGTAGSLCLIKGSQALVQRAPRLGQVLANAGSITLPLLCAHIIELDALPWQLILDHLYRFSQIVWPAAFLIQLISTIAIAFAIRLLPRPISSVFYSGIPDASQEKGRLHR
ncbi:acyltransferase family protein [Olsenella sp. HMSC062G07]|uniref:acyltransferase family protein n=1 Tax=Olsenella sp. HMSC062G07 TaxID=1739330 RepID=UPI0008A46CCC|nr:acyltransferase family protein [Olsenella sp. HMSC062G07]OFK23331.1 hypothetical protein HMPREF2826_05335 [Olsenella sp. HMSC062G07]